MLSTRADHLPNRSRASQSVTNPEPRFVDHVPCRECPNVARVGLTEKSNEDLVPLFSWMLQCLVCAADCDAKIPKKIGHRIGIMNALTRARQGHDTKDTMITRSTAVGPMNFPHRDGAA